MAAIGRLAPDLILTAVARYYGLSVSTLEGPRRDRNASTARQVTMHLLHTVRGLSADEIGVLLGGRERTTILYGLRRITEQIQKDNAFSTEISSIRDYLTNAEAPPTPPAPASEGANQYEGEIDGDSERPAQTRESIKMQAKVAEIGAIMGFSVWVPASDRTRVLERVTESIHDKFLRELNLGYDSATLSTIHQIDVLWLRRNAIVRAFEIERTTAIYSGLLRMADLLALQPNIDIKLHIIADEDRQKKTIREITRPAFDSFALPEKCSFLSYAKIDAIANHPDLRFLTDDIISSYEVWG